MWCRGVASTGAQHFGRYLRERSDDRLPSHRAAAAARGSVAGRTSRLSSSSLNAASLNGGALEHADGVVAAGAEGLAPHGKPMQTLHEGDEETDEEDDDGKGGEGAAAGIAFVETAGEVSRAAHLVLALAVVWRRDPNAKP